MSVQVTVDTQGVLNSVSEVAVVRVVEPHGASFQLAYRATPGAGPFTLIGPVTVEGGDLGALETDLQAAFDAEVVGVTVAAAPGDARLLTITFPNTLGDVELVGARDAGILLGPAAFELRLVNNEIVVLERNNLGQLTGASDALAETEIGSVMVTVPQSAMLDNTSIRDDMNGNPFDDLAYDVQTAINMALAAGELTLGFFDPATGKLSTGSVTTTGKTADYAPLLSSFPNDIGFSVKIGSNAYLGTLRAVNVLDTNLNETLFDGSGNLSAEATAAVTVSQLAAALQTAINRAIPDSEGIDVVVTDMGGFLDIATTSGAIEVIFNSWGQRPVKRLPCVGSVHGEVAKACVKVTPFAANSTSRRRSRRRWRGSHRGAPTGSRPAAP
jgi:hypothetical protein